MAYDWAERIPGDGAVYGSFNGQHNMARVNGNKNGVSNVGAGKSGNFNGNNNKANLNGNLNGRSNLGDGLNGNYNGNDNVANRQQRDGCNDIAYEDLDDLLQKRGKFAKGGELSHCGNSGNNNGNHNTGSGVNGNYNGNGNRGSISDGNHNGNHQGGAGVNGNNNGRGNSDTLPPAMMKRIKSQPHRQSRQNIPAHIPGSQAGVPGLDNLLPSDIATRAPATSHRNINTRNHNTPHTKDLSEKVDQGTKNGGYRTALGQQLGLHKMDLGYPSQDLGSQRKRTQQRRMRNIDQLGTQSPTRNKSQRRRATNKTRTSNQKQSGTEIKNRTPWLTWL